MPQIPDLEIFFTPRHPPDEQKKEEIFPTQSIPLYFPFSPSFSIFSALLHFLAFALDFPRSAESHTFVFELDFEFSSTSTTHCQHSFSVAIHCHQFGSIWVVDPRTNKMSLCLPTTKFEQKCAPQGTYLGTHLTRNLHFCLIRKQSACCTRAVPRQKDKV